MKDLLRNFPELEGMEADARQKLIVETQKRVVRQPAILAGLVASMGIPALFVIWILPLEGLTGSLATAGTLAVTGYGYLAAVVKPLMSAEFRKMGYPAQT